MADWHHDRITEHVRAFPGRALLVTGARDKAVPPGESRKLMPYFKSVQYEEVAGTGHLTHEERPDLVADLILREAEAAGLS
jgi:magnesium chelatase accessory protein